MTNHQRKSRNLPPGTLRAPADAQCPKTIHAFRYNAEQCEEGEFASVAEAVAWGRGKGVLWLNINGLGNVDYLQELNRELGFHPLALEDTLHNAQRPKVDVYEGHIYIVVRMFRYRNHRLEREQLSLFLADGVLVTVQEREGDCLDSVRHRLREGAGQVRSRPADYLLYSLLDAVVDSYFPLLEEAGEEIERLQERVLVETGRATLSRIHDMRRELLDLRRGIWPLRDALGTMLRDGETGISPQTQIYLRDCHDHAMRALDMTETYRELAASLMDIYLSCASNRMNEVMKVLTIISTIFIPLTFIAGVYGMNFEHMPELHWRWSYAGVWGLMLLCTLTMVAYFHRKGWLGGSDT